MGLGLDLIGGWHPRGNRGPWRSPRTDGVLSICLPGREMWQQHELRNDPQEQQVPAGLRRSYGGRSPARGMGAGPALNMEGPMRILGAGGKEETAVPSGKPVSSSLLSLWVLLCPVPFSVLFCSSSSFHRPTLSSPAPLQATVLMTRSREDGRTGLCCQCVNTDPSQHLSQSPWSGAVGVGKGSSAPGTLCGQLIGRNRSIRALPASAVSQAPSVQINRSRQHVLG